MIGKLVETLLGMPLSRLLSVEACYRRQRRLASIRKVAQIDPRTIVGDAATITNYSGRAEAVSIGQYCAIHGHLLIMPQGGRIRIGDKSLVGPETRIWSAESIDIGSYVMISHYVNIHDNISHSLLWQERRQEIDLVYPHLTLTPHTFNLKASPIVIEDDVWIGFNASIMRGVRIGRGAIIGAGTMVTEDVEPFNVVVGNPMRVVRRMQEIECRDVDR